MLTVHGDRKAGNCLKVAWVAAHLGIALDWRAIDILKGETRTPNFLALNPDGRVPTLVLEEGSLEDRPFLVGASLSLADVALVAYTRLAHEGGFDLAPYPALRAWIPRVEAALGITD